MSKRWMRSLAFVGAIGLALGSSAAAAEITAAASAPSAGVAPNAISMMDCNGHSPKYKEVKPDMGGLCSDPVSFYDGRAWRLNDNGHYVGHDEPSLRFLSTRPGSGNNMSYLMRLSTDPRARPTISRHGTTVSDYAELSPAPWFGLQMCDPASYPQNPCIPDSDRNIGALGDGAVAAGSAFMELQFYPPGYPPFADAPSCTQNKWCVALTIDSLEQTKSGTLNLNCVEPVNFAFLQRNGVPAGPPSPQLSNISTVTPNRQTLEMNPGDRLTVSIHDTRQGLFTGVSDLTTHQTGSMVASAANGFMNTDVSTCNGTRFSFHPEYSTARQQNGSPWADLEGAVMMEDEIGHFEPCSSVAHKLPFSLNTGGETFSDNKMFQTCVGGFEGPGHVGEGPCDPATGVCQNAQTEGPRGPRACPSNNAGSGLNCEFSDASCFPAGTRTITTNRVNSTVRWPIAGCEANIFQNGDLDYDGSPYIADWPDGSSNHPTTFQYIGPFTGRHTYPQIQFESDGPASEFLCNVRTGAGCRVPPVGPRDGVATFYPFWTLSRGCLWNFGNVIRGQTKLTFGKAAEYGHPHVARFGGTVISAVLSNPQFAGSCRPTLGASALGGLQQ